MAPQISSDVTAISIAGSFTLDITPKWLRDNQLIGKPEFDQLAFQILLPDELAEFALGWLEMQVTREALRMRTAEGAESERLRDVAAGILRAADDISAAEMTLRRQVELTFEDDSRAWHVMGDVVVRNDFWEGVLSFPGMHHASFYAMRPNLLGGWINVTIGPSEEGSPGVVVTFSDHYTLERVESEPSTRPDYPTSSRRGATAPSPEKIGVALDILAGEWGNFLRRGDAVIRRLVERVKV